MSAIKANAISINEECSLDPTKPYEIEPGLNLFNEDRGCDIYNVDGLCYHGPVDMNSFYVTS